MTISREPSRGTTLMVHLPLPLTGLEAPLARAAG
jgi:hypothetical protein